MAFLSVYVLTGRFLWDTYYFVYDIYMVGLGILSVQVILGFMHYIWSKDQFEEVDLVTEEGLSVYGGVGRQARPRQLNPVLRTYLLKNVEDRYVDDVATGSGITQRMLPPTKKDRLQWELIHRLDWSDIAAFYSKGNSTYLVRWSGNAEVLDASLSNIKRLMDTGIFFSGAKSLIAHHNAVVGVTKIGNGRVKLMMEPAIPVDTRLSRVATQQFRTWYLA
jgi:hypothetical protein